MKFKEVLILKTEVLFNCCANQLTGFYVRKTLAVNGLST